MRARGRRRAWILSCGSAAVLAAALAGRAVPAAEVRPAAPDESVAVRLVQIPVEITRRGEPVLGLGPDDFVVEDQGRRQTVVSVDLVNHAAIDPADPEIPLAARRHIVLLLDRSNAGTGAARRAIDAALAIVDAGLTPADLVAVATFRDTEGARVVLGFTTDRDQVRAALSSVDAPDGLARRPDPLMLTVFGPGEGGFGDRGADAGGRGGRPDADVELREATARAERLDRGFEARHVGAVIAGFRGLADLLGGVPARKHVVFLSEGFDDELVTATADRARVAEMNTAGETGELWKIDSDERFGDAGRLTALDGMLDALRRADCVVHAVDIASTLAGAAGGSGEDGSAGRRSGANGLSFLASGSGGRFVAATNDLAAAATALVDATRVTYVVSYRPDRLRDDGAWHRVQVRVPDAGRGARVSARPGYFAPTAAVTADPGRRRLDLAGRLLSGRAGGDFDTAALATGFDVGDARGLVAVLTEVAGPALLAGRDGAGAFPIEIFGYAFDRAGAVHGSFHQRMTVDPGAAGAAFAAGGAKHYAAMRLPPGPHLVRVLVVVGDTGRSSLAWTRVDVPGSAPERLAITPPLFADPPGRWALARLEDGGEDAAFPFVAGGRPFLPAVRPDRPATGPSRAVVFVRAATASPLGVRATFVGPPGYAPRTLDPLPVAERLPGGLPGYDALVVELPAPGPQDEAIEITVTDAGGRTATAVARLAPARP